MPHEYLTAGGRLELCRLSVYFGDENGMGEVARALSAECPYGLMGNTVFRTHR
jgi:hypothetical protein